MVFGNHSGQSIGCRKRHWQAFFAVLYFLGAITQTNTHYIERRLAGYRIGRTNNSTSQQTAIDRVAAREDLVNEHDMLFVPCSEL
jgi:hypothetical protein